jgi:hypothetical protein
MSSSDIDFEVGENSCFGYQYEPEYTEEELAIDKNFCSCGHCVLLPKQTECLCCKQLIKTFVPVDIVHFSQNKESTYVLSNFNIVMNII